MPSAADIEGGGTSPHTRSSPRVPAADDTLTQSPLQAPLPVELRPGPADAGPSRPPTWSPAPLTAAFPPSSYSPTAYGVPDDSPTSTSTFPGPSLQDVTHSIRSAGYDPSSCAQIRSQSLPTSALPLPLPVTFAPHPSRSQSIPIPIHEFITAAPAPIRSMSTTSTQNPTGIGTHPHTPNKAGIPKSLRSPPTSTRSTKRSIASETPYQALPDEDVFCVCLGAPCPRRGEGEFWASLGELCVGAALCQCFPCGRHDPKY